MPQQSIFTNSSNFPQELTVRYSCPATDPDSGITVVATITNGKGEVLSAGSITLRGIEADVLPDVAEQTLLEWWFGTGISLGPVMRRLQKRAREHVERNAQRGGNGRA